MVRSVAKELESNLDEGGVEITIINTYGYKNKGDSAILLSMMDSLRDQLGPISFNIESWHPELDQEIFDAHVYGTLWKYGIIAPYLRISPLAIYEAARKLPLLYFELGGIWENRIASFLLREEESELLRRMNDSDLILSCGGGFLHDSHGPAFLKHLFSLEIAARLETPVMVYAQSIGPFRSERFARLTSSVLNRVDYITLRDQISETYLAEIGVSAPPCQVTADAAFLLDSEIYRDKTLLEEIQQSKLPIGITVRDWKYPNSEDPSEKRENYREEMARYVDELVVGLDGDIFFFCHTPSDADEARRIMTRSNNRNRMCILDPDIPPRELKYLTGEVDLFIGTRMHSTIFSMGMGTPTISIPYLPKSSDLMSRLELDDLVLKIEDVNHGELMRITRELLSTDKYQSTMGNRVPQMSELAKKNVEIAEKLLRG